MVPPEGGASQGYWRDHDVMVTQPTLIVTDTQTDREIDRKTERQKIPHMKSSSSLLIHTHTYTHTHTHTKRQTHS